MAKFIKVPLQDKLISSEAAGATVSGKLTLADTSALSIGDYVHNMTLSKYATITAIDSATLVTLSADIALITNVMSVYSGTVSTVKQLVSAEQVLLVAQPVAVTDAIGMTTLTYASGTGADVVTISHVGNQQLSVAQATSIEIAILEAHSSNNRPESFKLASPSVACFSIRIA